MDVTVNGERAALEPRTTLAALVEHRAGTRKGVAVAVNEEVVPRSRWDTTEVGDGDRIEILTAAQGG